MYFYVRTACMQSAECAVRRAAVRIGRHGAGVRTAASAATGRPFTRDHSASAARANSTRAVRPASAVPTRHAAGRRGSEQSPRTCRMSNAPSCGLQGASRTSSCSTRCDRQICRTVAGYDTRACASQPLPPQRGLRHSHSHRLARSRAGSEKSADIYVLVLSMYVGVVDHRRLYVCMYVCMYGTLPPALLWIHGATLIDIYPVYVYTRVHTYVPFSFLLSLTGREWVGVWSFAGVANREPSLSRRLVDGCMHTSSSYTRGAHPPPFDRRNQKHPRHTHNLRMGAQGGGGTDPVECTLSMIHA